MAEENDARGGQLPQTRSSVGPPPRDDYTWPWMKSAHGPDGWTEKWFWVLLTVAAAAVAVHLAVDEAKVDLGFGLISGVRVKRDVVMAGLKFALVCSAAVYTILGVLEV